MFWRAKQRIRALESEYGADSGHESVLPSRSPAAKKKFTTERTETTEKSTSARASRDYKVRVPCLLTHSLCLDLFSVTSVCSPYGCLSCRCKSGRGNWLICPRSYIRRLHEATQEVKAGT